MKIRELFLSDITRDIPPVIYFHGQSPEKLQSEVSEYIITGGWPKEHPNHRRVPNGIHEQYILLLNGIVDSLAEPGGPSLPTSWISGFYGSGKSSFAKLFGLALDGAVLPDGSTLEERLLQRDTSPLSHELRAAWQRLRWQIEPISVVFDVGSTARNNEHIHAVALRQLQIRLGYSKYDSVAAAELMLEREGLWQQFLQKAQQVLAKPWEEVKNSGFASEDFSHVMHALFPERYREEQSWYDSRAGLQPADSPEEVVVAIQDMIAYRRPKATVFFVIDEVSQYMLASTDRADRLRAFATALGANLRGKVWLLALGQQKLEEQAEGSFLGWVKDRFPPRLRIHLAATNIRDVIHKRLLQKKSAHVPMLEDLFERTKSTLRVSAYEAENLSTDDFVDFYPLLPSYIELLLKITTALRIRSSRVQGDDQAIRGLLQMLGELFRAQRLADEDLGRLVTLDQIYDVQQSALDAETQNSMARIFRFCAEQEDATLPTVAKAVALLELVQETTPTDAKLVSQCLYQRIDQQSNFEAVQRALETLRQQNLLSYSERHGYKIQSSAGEEWQRERNNRRIEHEEFLEVLQELLKNLLAEPTRGSFKGRSFPWQGFFSDGRNIQDATFGETREDAAFRVDFRLANHEERSNHNKWAIESNSESLANRFIWLSGDSDKLEDAITELLRSQKMVALYDSRAESLTPARRLLLQEEKNRAEDLKIEVKQTLAETWVDGKIYFRSIPSSPREYGSSFSSILTTAANLLLPRLFDHLVSTTITPTELMQLVATDLSGISPKYLPNELGIVELDNRKYIVTCSGHIPIRILDKISRSTRCNGHDLVSFFGNPPYGYTPNVVKACVAGLLRAGKIQIETEASIDITAVRDAGTRDVFEKDRSFRKAIFRVRGDDSVGPQTRARIRKLFQEFLQIHIEAEDELIANTVSEVFPRFLAQHHSVQQRLARLLGGLSMPQSLQALGEALEACLRNCRNTVKTVLTVRQYLEQIKSVPLLQEYDVELSAEALQQVQQAAQIRDNPLRQLREAGRLDADLEAATQAFTEQLNAPRPWRDIVGLQPHIELVQQRYQQARKLLLSWQEEQAEAARQRIKLRDGYLSFSADESNKVLRHISLVVSDSTMSSLTPRLKELSEGFVERLARATEEANDTFDEILSQHQNKRQIIPVALTPKNRVLQTEDDVNTLLEEYKTRLLEQIRRGVHIRLV